MEQLRFYYHLNVFCEHVPKYKAWFDTADEAELAAIAYYEEHYPWALALKRYDFHYVANLIENGYAVTCVREDRRHLFRTGMLPLEHDIEYYFKRNQRDDDEDIKLSTKREGRSSESSLGC